MYPLNEHQSQQAFDRDLLAAERPVASGQDVALVR